MRQRAVLLLLAAAALWALLTALSLHQSRLQDRTALGVKEAAGRALEARLGEAAREIEKLKAASSAADAVAQKTQAVGAELKEKLEGLQKELAARDQALQGVATQVQSKLAELAAGLGELKTQVAAPGTGIAAKIDELAKLKDQSSQLATQVVSLEAKLKEKEGLLQALNQERERQAADLRRRDADLSALRKELDAERKRAGGREASPKLDEKPAPAVSIRTTVEAADGSSGVIVLGAGRRSGVEAGHVFAISRDGRSVGRVRVIKVYDDLAGAEVIETGAGETIQVGDRAAAGAATEAGPGAASGPATGAGPGAAAAAAPRADLRVGKTPPPPPPLPEGGEGGAAK